MQHFRNLVTFSSRLSASVSSTFHRRSRRRLLLAVSLAVLGVVAVYQWIGSPFAAAACAATVVPKTKLRRSIGAPPWEYHINLTS